MTAERLDQKLEDMRALIKRLQKAAGETNLSEEERKQIAAELRAIQDQIRQLTRSI